MFKMGSWVLALSLAAICFAGCGDNNSNDTCSTARFASQQECVQATIAANNNCGCIPEGDLWVQVPNDNE